MAKMTTTQTAPKMAQSPTQPASTRGEPSSASMFIWIAVAIVLLGVAAYFTGVFG